LQPLKQLKQLVLFVACQKCCEVLLERLMIGVVLMAVGCLEQQPELPRAVQYRSCSNFCDMGYNM
jgi:hypothetical protein